ncbi:type IV pilus twitching motility protein PilT [Papillibacter cinnamivorans]|uniref:Twitching motility protein PilT n=1 Tax=Papillibacter cinnamivorans DSM 12816 TaxID=1122930 RepID=A0A1W1Z3I7_9FIRM|nr:type IV pilus twitching motility protein PilT [Papillibacter cinnamivorans]SMC42671.1 twitching motility protein PilT [Papillibacter cinnamivorans DSM 12816]
MSEINGPKLDELLEYTFNAKATDLHVAVGTAPMIRLNSRLTFVENMPTMTPDMTAALVDECVSPAKRKTLEENGEVDFSFSRPGLGRFRSNIFKQRGSYSMALRSLPFAIPAFETLGIPESVRPLTNKKSGLILATGATGSGKSTTLASMIDIINSSRRCHIITIEDPIEYLHRHKTGLVNQREVGWDTRSFATALRAALREDPDVILVGEMRDVETIDIALTAAETGHLVFSTLHTIGAAKTVNRILDAFPHDQQAQVRTQLAAVLEGVISQQLLPKEDGSGLVLACEVMLVNTAIRNLIREGKPHQINTVLQTSTGAGMQTMDASLADLVNRRIISYDDALTRTQDTQTFQQLCSRKW